MANKRRPKKTKAPYKCYGPNGLVKRVAVSAQTGGFRGALNDEEEEEEEEIEMNGLMSDVDHSLIDSTKDSILPIEIYELIMTFSDKNLKFLLVCKLFYRLYIPMIYNNPILNSYNFFNFVETLSNRKSKLGSFVERLDLSMIIQSGKNSFVSKLLRRCSSNLKVFVAPQTSFGIAPLISLRNCHELKILDLGLVSETVNLSQLFHAINLSKNLTHLSFPRSSISIEDYNDSFWPPKLEYLRLSGGITDEFVTDSVFPKTIKTLEFAHCPILKDFAIYSMLSKFGESLRSLSFHYPMPGLNENSMDFIFTYCPNLVFLQITVDYCSRFLFGEDLLPLLPEGSRPLKTIWIESSGGLGQSSKIHPDDLIIAIMEERLPNLKNVRVTPKLGWDFNSDDISVLVDLLEENGGGLYVSDH